jgi:hypothetical protein
MMIYIVDNPKYFKLIGAIILAITTTLCILLVARQRQALELEKELARINHELYLKQVIHDRRMKQFEKQEQKHKEQIQKLKSEL